MPAVTVMCLSTTILGSTSQSIQDMWCNSYLNSWGQVTPNQLAKILVKGLLYSSMSTVCALF
jgi:hypothetical protein